MNAPNASRFPGDRITPRHQNSSPVAVDNQKDHKRSRDNRADAENTAEDFRVDSRLLHRASARLPFLQKQLQEVAQTGACKEVQNGEAMIGRGEYKEHSEK